MQIPQQKHDFDYFSACLPQFTVEVASKKQIFFFFSLKTVHVKSQLVVEFGRRIVFVAISRHNRELTRRETKIIFLLFLQRSQIGTHKPLTGLKISPNQ